MTIKIEREALLRLLSAPPSTPLLERSIGRRDECYRIEFTKPDCPLEKPSSPRDDDSVSTATTACSSDSDDEILEDFDRRVSFAQPLVTEEWTREYTPKDEIASLYYSTEEISRCVIAGFST